MPVLDPEGAHLAALRRLGNFAGRRAVELGCGEGRPTLGIAADAAHVLASTPTATRSRAPSARCPTSWPSA